jgi:hypothetical protein
MHTRLILMTTLLGIGLVSSLGSAQANADALLECTVYAQAQLTAWAEAEIEWDPHGISAWVAAGASAAGTAYVKCRTAAEQTLEEASTA